MGTLRRIGIGLLLVIGAYFVVRAIVELFVVDYGNPASYRDAWGGPSLFGVLLVHCGPGIIAGALMVLAWRRRKAVARR